MLIIINKKKVDLVNILKDLSIHVPAAAGIPTDHINQLPVYHKTCSSTIYVEYVVGIIFYYKDNKFNVIRFIIVERRIC